MAGVGNLMYTNLKDYNDYSGTFPGGFTVAAVRPAYPGTSSA